MRGSGCVKGPEINSGQFTVLGGNITGKLERSGNGMCWEGWVRRRRWGGDSRTRRGRCSNLSHCDKVEWTRRVEELECASWKTKWDCINVRIAPNLRRMEEEKKRKRRGRRWGLFVLANKTVVLRRGQ